MGADGESFNKKLERAENEIVIAGGRFVVMKADDGRKEMKNGGDPRFCPQTSSLTIL